MAMTTFGVKLIVALLVFGWLVTSIAMFISYANDALTSSESLNEMTPVSFSHGSSSSSVPSRRFPVLGTDGFSRRCRWAVRRIVRAEPSCILYATVSPRDNEGISAWTTKIAEAFMLARQAGCQILVDYGKGGVDIAQVLTPWPDLRKDHPGDQLNNWTVPSPHNFRCKERCYPSILTSNNDMGRILKKLERPILQVPNYRFAYSKSSSNNGLLEPGRYRNLTSVLKGFDIETGMACSLGALLHLSPGATKFEPTLFSKILPTLRKEENLVVALYIRTGVTDRLIKNKTVSDEELIRRARGVIEKHALSQEKKYLSGYAMERNENFSRVVWMVITDSPIIKIWATDTYNGSEADYYSDEENSSLLVVPREILTTASRGAHIKPKMGPSIVDFAEAFIDWYLIGESDFVVSFGSVSFSATASQRTARPLYLEKNGDRAEQNIWNRTL